MRVWSVILAVSIGAFGLAGCSVLDRTGNVFSLSVGDCFNGPAFTLEAEDVEDVGVVSCSEPHMYEVYSEFELTGSSWPGQFTVSSRADEFCRSRFASFVGMDYDRSEWYFYPFFPTQDSWNRANDRVVTCSVGPEYGKTTGSARGTGR